MASAQTGVHILTLDEVRVDDRLVTGDKFIKWCDQDSGNNGSPVTLQLDRNGFFLYWLDQNKETRFLDMSQVRDVRTGQYARVPKDPKLREIVSLGAESGPVEDKTITVVHGTDFVNTHFINFCTTKKDVAVIWHRELLKVSTNVLASNISSHGALNKIFTQIKLMKTTTTATSGSGGKKGASAERVPVKSIHKLFAQNKEDRKVIERALDIAGLPSKKSDEINVDKFDFQDFFNFYIELVQRKEVEKIFGEIKSEGKRNTLTASEFMHFVNGQRDPRLNEILYPYCTIEKAQELIARYEQNKFNVKRHQLSFDGFLRYLMSEENQIVAEELFDLHSDMSLPLSHYFIQSSHNTYLTGHQWTGKSSVEIYRQVLLAGCRCIELDLWDGRTKEEEPVIVHGYTLVPEINARDVIAAIAECAFKTTDFPLILSFENHCRPKQQAKIAQYCKELFGDMLLQEPIEGNPLSPGHPLPSPEALTRKIIIKNKKKHVKAKQQQQQPPSSQDEAEQHQQQQASDRSDEGPQQPGGGVSNPVGGAGLGAAPGGADLDSGDSESDDDDDEGGGGGGQQSSSSAAGDSNAAVAIQTSSSTSSSGAPLLTSKQSKQQQKEKNREKESKAAEEISALVNYVQAVRFHGFEQAEKKNRSYEMSSFDEANAVSLLKESPMEFVKYNKRQISRIFPKGTRLDSSNFMPQVFWNAGCQLVALNYQTLDLPMQLQLGIYEYNRRSGYLAKPDFMCRHDRSFDPFTDTPVDGIVPGTLSIQILSGQFLTDKHVGTFVEVDMFGLPCDTVRRKFRTKVVPNNGICPKFTDEPFVFKQVVLPDLAVVRIAVCEESGRLIGHRVLPVKGIRPGYRHVSLRNESGQYLTLPSIFVHVKVQDYVPDRFSDFAEALANPIRYQSELEKRTQQLAVLTGDTGADEQDGGGGGGGEQCLGLSTEMGDSGPASLGGLPSSSTSPSNAAAAGVNPNASFSSSFNSSHAFIPGESPSSLPPSAPSSASAVVASSSPKPKSRPMSFKRITAPSLSRRLSPANSVTDSGSGTEAAAGPTELPAAGGSSSSSSSPPALPSLETFLSHKVVLEKMAERDKKIAQLNKKHKKDVDKIKKSYQSKEEKAAKTSKTGVVGASTKLVKILQPQHTTDKGSSDASSDQQAGSSDSAADQKLKQLRQQMQAELSSLIKDKEKAEKELYEKYSHIILSCAEKQMRSCHAHQLKQLQSAHERECAEVMSKLEAQAQEEITRSNQGDKEEMMRLKKEKRSFIVKRGLEERRKLNDFHKKKVEDLSKSQEEMKKALKDEMRVNATKPSPVDAAAL